MGSNVTYNQQNPTNTAGLWHDEGAAVPVQTDKSKALQLEHKRWGAREKNEKR